MSKQLNIVVTGASKGIGKAIVQRCCQEGNHQVIAIARNVALLHQLVTSCQQLNARAKVIPLSFDLANDDIEELVNKMLQHQQSIDVLINNAGLLINKPFAQLSQQEIGNQFNVNVLSVFRLINGLLPYFHQPAHIVNIGSMGGVQGSVKFKGLSAYSASKAALATLTECLAVELKEKQIYVNCLALGAVETTMFQQAFPNATTSTTAAAIADFIVPFALYQYPFFNGKIVPVSASTP